MKLLIRVIVFFWIRITRKPEWYFTEEKDKWGEFIQINHNICGGMILDYKFLDKEDHCTVCGKKCPSYVLFQRRLLCGR